MKILGLTKVACLGFLLLAFFAVPFIYADAAVWVNGYYRSNGTYVQGHYRSNPDGNPYNNWSFPGNTNPYTGETAGGNPDTYLRNYYDNGSSGYSSGYSSYRTTTGGYYIGTTLFCDSGYIKKDNSCNKVPENSYSYGSEDFYCYSGYLKQGDKCIKPSNGSIIGGTLYCDVGYVVRNGQCLTNTQDCQLYYGDNTVGYRGTAANTSSCGCKNGYEWNASQTNCIPKQIPVNTQPRQPSIEDLKAQIAALLEQIASLQAQLAGH